MIKPEMRVIRRYHAKGVWAADSALHIGGEPDALDHDVDMALLRGADGKYRIPGTSIAGVCRSYLARRMMGAAFFQKDAIQPHELRRLFGKDNESLLTVFDANPAGSPAPSRRDGVRLESKTRTAARRAKFDLDVLPAGATFTLQFQLRIREVDLKIEPQLLKMLRAILEAMQQGEIRIGARTRKGLGRGRVGEWQISLLDMTTREHMEAWLKQAWLNGAAIAGPAGLSTEDLEDTRRRFSMEADLRIKTSMLIRAGGSAPRSPDMVHLTERGQAILSGSALGGALRHRIEKIASTLLDEASAQAAVVRLFGPIHKGGKDRGTALQSGRVTVEEAKLDHGAHFAQGRVALDRAFQSPIRGALFDEAAYWPKDDDTSVNWRFAMTADLSCYEDPAQESCDVRLLAQAFKDLLLGDLSVGGEAGVGRGVSMGAEVWMKHPDAGRLNFRQKGSTVEFLEGDSQEWNKVLNG